MIEKPCDLIGLGFDGLDPKVFLEGCSFDVDEGEGYSNIFRSLFLQAEGCANSREMRNGRPIGVSVCKREQKRGGESARESERERTYVFVCQ